jgi:hypothetical protein
MQSSFGARHPCFFHSPPASECLLFAWPKRRHQEKGHPTLAPYAQSLCFGCARPLRGSLTVHPWTGIELAHIVWAILRTIPAQPRRDRGDPVERASCAPMPKAKPKPRAPACGKPLWLGCAGCAVSGPPMQRQRDGGDCMDAGGRATQDDCMDAGGRATPGAVAEQLPSPETAVSGGPSLWLLFSDCGLLPFALRASFAVRAAPAAQWPRKRK